MPLLLGELSHVPTEQIVILVATGTHRAVTSDELAEMLGRDVTEHYRVVNHSAFDKAGLSHVGETPGGIPIWLNRHWVESDLRITTGFVEPHFFAGFSADKRAVPERARDSRLRNTSEMRNVKGSRFIVFHRI